MTHSSTSEASSSRPVNNLITASVPADWTPGSDATEPTPYAEAVDRVLHLTAEIARNLVGAHQGAATLIISDDWKHARKWFSLSSKYANWDEYRAPAAGVGLHALVVTENKPLRLTQAEVEAHAAWRGFGDEATKHPPMRGWLAVPLIGQDQHNYGLLQLSDKYNDEEFTEEDESHLIQLAQLTAMTLDALRTIFQDGRIGLVSEQRVDQSDES